MKFQTSFSASISPLPTISLSLSISLLLAMVDHPLNTFFVERFCCICYCWLF